MIMLSSILNFAINEELVERNPCRGLRVIDPVKKRDKRLPFSEDQLRLIFNSPIYREEIDAHRHTARFWVSLISLFSGMRLNEICALDTADLQIVDKVPCFLIRETADKSIKTNASERYVPAHQRLIDTSTPSGKMLFQMLGVFAEFERSIIRSRVMAGLERTKAKGTKLGRPSLAPIEVKQIRLSLDKGLSIRKAAKKHNVSTATIMRVKQAAHTTMAPTETVASPTSG
jgi:hypothetical protein